MQNSKGLIASLRFNVLPSSSLDHILCCQPGKSWQADRPVPKPQDTAQDSSASFPCKLTEEPLPKHAGLTCEADAASTASAQTLNTSFATDKAPAVP